ncbi:MAG: extracellular solute-binding protein [Steroidobacteraceae bacterium]
MRATSIVGISAFCALLCACGAHEHGGSAPVPGTAERVVHYYNWANYIGPDTIPAFEAATGIKVIYDAYDAEETLETVLLMGGTGYDVVGASMGTFATGIAAGAFMPLDRAQLPNWGHLDPHALAVLGQFDPGNRYAVPFLHSINGFAYNLDMVRARMPDAPVDSLDMLFKPDVVARFADCGVSFLDSPADVIQLALKYLHLDPNSDRPEDYRAVEALLLAVRPSIRMFDSNTYIHDLANRELCVAMSWSSDYSIAMARARAVGVELHLAFTIPREGANINYDALLIPAGAPHPHAAHVFLNYLLEPRVIAHVTNTLHSGNNNRSANAYVERWILADPALYPPPEVEARLYSSLPVTEKERRLRTRTWTRIKTGY